MPLKMSSSALISAAVAASLIPGASAARNSLDTSTEVILTDSDFAEGKTTAKSSSGNIAAVIVKAESTESPNKTADSAKPLSIRAKDWKIEAASEKGEAVGLRITGSGKSGNSVSMDVSEGLTVSVSDANAEHESKGIELDTKNLSSAQITLHGKSVINAEAALTAEAVSFEEPNYEKIIEQRRHQDLDLGMFKFTDHRPDIQYSLVNYGDLTINGKVSGYYGSLRQAAGTLRINAPDGLFIPGLVMLTGGQTDFGGKLTVRPKDGRNYPLHVMFGARLNLQGIDCADDEETRKFMLQIGPKSIVNVSGDVRIGLNGELGFNAGTLNIENGNSIISGRIDVSKGSIKNPKTTLNLKGGKMTVKESGIVRVRNLNLEEGAELTDMGLVRADVLNIGRGSTYVCTDMNSVSDIYAFGGPSGTFVMKGGRIASVRRSEDYAKWRVPSESRLEVAGGNYTLKELHVHQGAEASVSHAELKADDCVLEENVSVESGGILTVKNVHPLKAKGFVIRKNGTLKLEKFSSEGTVRVEQGGMAIIGSSDGVSASGEKSGRAVLYVRSPIQAGKGGLILGTSKSPAKRSAVYIGPDAELRIDLAALGDQPVIEAENFDISPEARVILIGAEPGKTYRLTQKTGTPGHIAPGFSIQSIAVTNQNQCRPAMYADGSVFCAGK